jgi:uncharacterized Zn-finger protein
VHGNQGVSAALPAYHCAIELGIAHVPRYCSIENSPLECGSRGFAKGPAMAEHVVPHFHNDPGVPVIEIGATEFMCVGATPPHDHPHVFLDMGEDKEIICPYCSTLYRYNPALDSHAARPPQCALPLSAAA